MSAAIGTQDGGSRLPLIPEGISAPTAIRRWRGLALATGVWILAATCKPDDGGIGPDGGLLQALTTSVTDSAPLGSTTARSWKIGLTNARGAEALAWTAATALHSSWLSLGSLTGTTPDSIRVFANPTGLALGVYRDTVILSTTVGVPARIAVELRVRECVVSPIAVASTINGTIGPSDCASARWPGRFAKRYSFSGVASDSVTAYVSGGLAAPTLDIDTLASGVPVGQAICTTTGSQPCLRYLRLPRAGTYYVEVVAGAGESGTFSLRLEHPHIPGPPDSLLQFRADSASGLPVASITPDGIAVLRAVGSDPDADSLRIEVEVAPIGTAFTGVVTGTSGWFTDGHRGIVRTPALQDNQGYHWRARVLDATGRRGSWTSFGGNSETVADFTVGVPDAPNTPASLGQYLGNGTTAIATGGFNVGLNTVFKATVSDPDPADALRMEVEVQALGSPFTGTATASSAPVSPGSSAQVAVGGLPDHVSYHWRARTVDGLGQASAWTSYGGNAEDATDFRLATGPAPSTSLVTTSAASVASGAAVTLTLQARDAAGAPIATGGLAVVFAAAGGTSTGIVGATTDHGDGTYTSTFTGVHAGSATTISATMNGAAVLTGTPTITVTAGTPDRLVFTAVPSAGVAGGALAAVTVIVRDREDNLVTTASGAVVLTLGANPGGATLGGTLATVPLAGVATFADLTLDKAGAGFTLVASSGTLTGATSSPIAVTPGAPARVVVIAQPASTARSGEPLTVQPVVRLRDAFDNDVRLPGVAVTASIFSGGGTLGGVTTRLTDSAGVATFAGLTLTGLAGEKRLGFGGTGLAGLVSTPIVLSPGGATQLGLYAGDGQSSVAGTPVAVAPAVVVHDQSGNPIAGVSVVFALSAGGGVLEPTTPVMTNADGVAAVTMWRLGPTVGYNEITATAAGLAGSPVGFTATGTTGPPAVVIATGGDDLSATVGSALPMPHEVEVADANGNPVVGAVVSWSPASGGGSVSSTSSLTDAGGRSRSIRTLGSTPGAYTTTASVVGVTGVVTFHAVATVGGAAHLVVVSGNAQSGQVSSALPSPLAVRVTDALGNPVTGSVVAWLVTSGDGSMTATSSTDTSGIALASWTLGPQSGDQTARATGAGTPVDFVATATSGPPSPARSTVSASPEAISADGGVSTITVTVRDAHDNVVPGAVVVLAAAGAGNTLTQPMAPTDAAGVAVGSLRSTVSGSKVVSATVGGVPLTQTATVAVTAGVISAGTSTVTVSPGTVSADAAQATVTVTVRDGTGNPISGAIVTLTATGVGSVLTQPVGATNTEGVATGSVSSTAAGSATISATAGGTSIAQSATLIVTAGAVSAATSTIAADASPISADGGIATVTVTVRDAQGNPVQGASVLLGASGSGNVITQPVGATDAAGAATGAFSSTQVGAKVLTAMVNGTLTVAQRPTVVVTPGVVSAVRSSLSVALASITAGGGVSTITAVARDAHDNAVPGATIVLLSTGTGNVLQQPAVADSTGAGVGTLASSVAETKVISAEIGGVAVTQTSTVTVVPGSVSASHSTVARAPPSISADGVAATITVTVRDAFDNALSGAAVVLSATGAGNTLTQPVGLTDAQGIANGSLSSSVAGLKSITATASGTAITQAAVVTVTPGAVSPVRSLVGAVPDAISADGDSAVVTVTVLDAFDNPVPGATVAITASGSGNTVSQPLASTNAAGVATGALRSVVAGAKVVSATVNGLLLARADTVSVSPGVVSPTLSTLSVSPGSLSADGGSATVTVVARDAHSNFVGGASVVLAATGAGNLVTQPVGDSTRADGVGIGTVSSVGAGQKTVSATVAGVALAQTALLNVGAGAVSASHSRVTGSPAAIAEDTEVSVITVTVLDQHDNPVQGRTVVVSATGSGNTLVQPTVVSDASGVATGTFRSVVAGVKSISAVVDGAITIVQAASVTVTAGAISPNRSTIAVGPAEISADGGLATVTVTVLDANSNPIPGAAVVLGATGTGNTITQPIGPTDANGAVTGTLRSIVAGVKTVTAIVNGTVPLQASATATVVAGAVSAAVSQLDASPLAVTTDGEASVLTVTVRDAYGNAVSGASVTLGASGAGTALTQPSGPTGADGVVSGELRSTIPGVKVVTATVDGTVVVAMTASVSVSVGAVSPVASSLSASPGTLSTDGGSATITATVRDANHNPISGAIVSLLATGAGNSVQQPVGTTNTEGVVTGLLSSTAAGVKVVTAVVNGAVSIAETAAVTVGAGNVSPGASSLTAAPAAISADGGTTVITVTARDANGNPIAGAAVALSATGVGNALVQPGPTDADGVTTGSLSATSAGARVVSAIVDGTRVTQTALVTVDPGVVAAATSTLVVAPLSISADGQVATVTVTVRDANNNAVSGATVALMASGPGNDVTQPSAVTDASGVATGAVSSTVVGVKTISATGNGIPISQTQTLTVIPGAVSVSLSTVSASPAAVSSDGEISTITVIVRDAHNNVIPGATVVLSANGGGYAITQPAVTNASGVTTGTFASTLAGVQTVSATANGIPITQAPVLTVTAGVPTAARSTVSASPTSVTTDGETSTITVTARDASNNPVPGVTVTLAATGSGNAVTQPVAVTNASGVATGTVSSTVAESKTISVTVDGTPVAQTAAITVHAGQVSGAHTLVSASPSTINADGQTSMITVTARDASNNPVPGATVVLTASGAGNTVTQPTAVTDIGGVATGLVSSTVAGAKTISATVNGAPVTQTASVTVTAGVVSAATTTVSAAPASISADGGASTITVTVRDANNNPVPGATVVLAATGTGNTVGQPASVTNASGVVTGSVSSTVAAAKTVSATANGTAITQTATVTVTPGVATAAQTTVSASPASINTDGQTSTITVTARDVNNNVVPGVTVTLAATGSGNTVVQPGAVTNASGVATGTVASTVTGTKTVTATLNGGVSVTQTATVTVTPGAVSASLSTVSASPTAVSSDGEISTITVTVRDAHSNVVPGATVVLAANGGGNAITQPAVTDASGVAIGTVSSTVAGSKTISTTANGTAITQTQTLTVTSGAISAATSTVAVSPTSITTDGQTTTVTVTVRDVHNNVVPGATVVLAASGPGNTVTQPSAVTNASGVATGTVGATVAGSKTISAVADGTPIVQTAAVTVTSGAVAGAQTLVVASPSTINAGGQTSTITVTARDANGNPVSGVSVTLAVTGTGNSVTQPAGVTNETGVATGAVSSTVAETKTVSATMNGTLATQTAALTVTPGALSAATSSVTIAPSTVTADGQTSTAIVTVRDANNNPVPGVLVTLAATGSGNTVMQPAGPTDAGGVATGTVRSTVPEAKIISAVAGGTAITQTQPLTVTSGAISAGTSTVAISPASITTDGQASTVTVSVRDANGNPIAGATVLLTASGSGNVVTQPAAVTDAGGVATGSVSSTVPGAKTIAATANGTVITQTAVLTVGAGVPAAAQSSVSASPLSINADGQVSTITVTARDATGNPVPGATVVLSVTGLGNSVVQPVGATNASGVATGTVASTAAGTKTVSVVLNGSVAVTQTAAVTVTPGAISATLSTVSASPTAVSADGQLSTITVTVRDANGNVIPGTSVVLAATGAGNTLTQPVGPTSASGVATASLASSVPEAKTISATANGIPLAQTAAVAVTLGAVSASQSSVVASPGAISADGQNTTVSVTVRDGNANPIAGATVVIAATGSGNTITQPGPTNASGVATGMVSSTMAAAKTISATADGTLIAQTPQITVTPGAISAAQSLVSASPSTIDTDGETSVITVTARDANNNPIPGATVVLFASGSGNAVTQPAIVTNASGVATGAVSSTVAAAKSISATINGTAVTQVATVTVVSGAVSATQSMIARSPPSISADGGAAAITVTVLDANGNPVTGATVMLAATGSGNTVTQPVGTTDTHGVITGTLASTVTGTKTVSATANGTALTSTAVVNVTPGVVSAATSTVATSPASISADDGASTITVTARDANGNLISGATVVVAATGSGNTLTQPASATDLSGVATGTLASTGAGAKTISATISGTAITQTGTVTVTSGAALALTISGGDNATGLVTTTLATPHQVLVSDAHGNPVPGVEIFWSAASGGGSVSSPLSVTDATGRASMTRTLGPTAGTQTTTAAATDLTPTFVTFTIDATVGGASRLEVCGVMEGCGSSGDSQTGAVTTLLPVPLSVRAHDISNNPVAGVTISWAVLSPNGGSLSAPTSVTNASGVATMTWTLGTLAGLHAVQASGPGEAVTFIATAVPGPVSAGTSTVMASPASLSADGGTTTVTVTVRDAHDNPISGATVILSAGGSGNTVTQPAAATNAGGVATGTISSTVAEGKAIAATANGTVITQTATVNVTAGVAAAGTSTASASPSAISADGGTSTITVVVRDANSNPVAGATVVLSASGTGNTVTQPAAVTNASGVATGAVSSMVAGAKTIAATANGTPIAQTTAVTVTTGGVSGAHASVIASPTTINTDGQTTTVTVTVRDDNDNPVVGADVLISSTGSGNTITQPASVTNASGVAIGAVSSTVPEGKTISATADGTPITQTAAIIVTPGAVSAARTSVSASPATIDADGQTSTITVTARDASNNPVPGVPVVLSVTGAGNSVTQPAVTTNASGIATGTVSSVVAGLKTVSAIVNGTPATQTPSVMVTAGAVSATTSSVVIAPSTITTDGQTSTITVTVRDANSNPVPGVAVVLIASGTGNVIVQPVGLTNVSGVAAGTIGSTVAEAKTISATANGTALTQTRALAVTPGVATAGQSTVSASPASITTDGQTSTITVIARDANNNPVPGVTVTLSASGAGNTVTQPLAVTNASGTATGTMSSTVAEAKTVSAAVHGTTVTQTASVTVTPGVVSAATSTVSALPASISADGGTSTITVTIRDANDNPVAGATVVLSASGTGNTVTQPAVTDASGVATATISSTVAGTKTVSATANGTAITQTLTLNVTPGAAAAGASSLAIAPSVISVDGQTSTVTVTVRDANNNVVPGATVLLSATGTGNTVTQPATATNASGVATGTISSTEVGAKTISATANGTAVTQTQTLTVTSGATSATNSTVAISPPSITTDGQTSTVTVTVRDANSNPIEGVTVVLAASGSGNTVTQPVAITNASGVAIGGVTSTVAEGKTISATASGAAITQTQLLTVTPGAISAGTSTVAASPASINTDGETSTVTVTARDANNNPIPGAVVVLSGSGAGNTVTQPAPATNASGVATGAVSSTVAGAKSISATINGILVTETATVTVIPGAVSASQSMIARAPPSISADGGTSTIAVTVLDANANPISGATVTLAATGSGNTVTQPVGTTDAGGVITGSVASTAAGAITVSATVNGTTTLTSTVALTVTPGAVSAATSTVSASPATISTDGGSSTVTVTVRDTHGNPIPGVTVALASSGTGNTVMQPAAVTNASGVATGTVASIVPEAKTISAVANGTAITQTAVVTATLGAVSGVQSSVAASPTTIDADGQTTAVTVTVRDGHGNPVVGASVVISATGTGNTVTQPAATNASGMATGTVSSTVAEGKTISATADGTPIAQTASVTVMAGALSAGTSTVTIAPGTITADGQSSTVTVTVRDANSNPVPGATVVLAASGAGNTMTQPVAVTNASGVATGTVRSTVAEAKTISATASGTPITQTQTLTVNAGVPTAAQSTVSASPASITTDGQTSTITVTARDANSNPVPGITVVLSATGTGNTIVQPVGTTNASGVATGTISSTVAQGKTVSATVSGTLVTQTASVTVTAGVVSAATTTVSAAPASISADGGASTITVTVRDANNNPVSGATVVLAATGTGNTVGQPASVTNASGVVTGSVSSTVAAAKTVSATANGTAITQTATVTVTPGVATAAQTTVSASPASINTDGQTSTITVTARDVNNNVVPGVTVTLAATGSGNTVVQPGAVTNASGVATGTVASTVTGTKTVTATLNGGVSVTQTATVTVTPGAVSASLSTVSASPTAVSSDGEISTITVTVRDAHSNVVPGATVVLAANGGGNAITQPAVTDASGVAIGTVSSTVAGSKTISTTANGTAITQTQTLTVTSGAISAATSTVAVSPTSITTDAQASTVTVTVRDANSNPIAGVTVLLAASGPGNTVTQPLAVTNASGVATGTVSSTVAAAKTISATANGTTITQTQTLTVAPGVPAAAQSTVSASPASIDADGQTSTITVTARDVHNNVVPGVTVVLAASGTGNTVTQPGAVTNASGIATGAVSSTVAQAKTVSATVNGTLVTQTTSVTVTAGNASAATTTVSAAPASITAGGGASSITVTVRDANNNPVPGVTIVLVATGSGNTVTQPVAVTNASGVATGTVSSTVAEVKTVSATANGTPITQTAAVTVTSGGVSAANSTVAISPASITTDAQTSTVTVTVRDASGNPIAGVTVAIAATGSGNTVTQPAAVTNASGVATGSIRSTVAAAKTVSATANGTAITQTATLTVTAGAVSAANSAVSAAPASIDTDGQTSTITVTARDASNNLIPGATVVLAASGTGNTVTQPAAVTNGSGLTTGSISSTAAAVKTISATINGTAVTQTASVAVIPGAPSAGTSTVAISPASISSDGGSSTVTVTVRDAHNNLVAGAAVLLAASGTGNTVTQPAAVTNAGGVATGTVTSTVAGTKTILASANGTGISQTQTLSVSAGALSADQSTIAIAPTSVVAGGAPATITVTARDANANPIGGAAVVLSATGTANTLVQPTGGTNSAGVATGSLTSSTGEVKTVSATINGTAITQTAALTVTNSAPDVTIASPTSGLTFAGGDTLFISASATDPEQGSLAPTALTYWVVLHHAVHTHPALPPTVGATGTLVIPRVGHLETDIFYRVYVSATDAGGLADTAFVDVVPRLVNITLLTSPSGLEVTVDGQPRTAPATVQSVVGMQRTFGATTPQPLGATSYEFASWSNDGPATQTIVAPATDLTLTATFNAVAPANVPPTVSITSPSAGATVTAGTPVTIAASASDTDGSVVRVEFLSGATLLGQDTSAPFTFAWTPTGTGSRSLTARAIDDDSASTTSAPVSVTVQAAGPGDVTAPIATFTSPANHALNLTGALTLRATATDAVGVTVVEFSVDGVLVGQDSTTPYQATLPATSAYASGAHVLRARAWDAAGNSSPWSSVSVTFGGSVALSQGFTSTTYVNGLNGVLTSLAWAPDGRLFVAEQSGRLRVIKNGVLLSTPFVNLPVNFFFEQGLLGVAIDPSFDTNHYVYVYYTRSGASGENNRISRFTANGDVALAGSELVLADLPLLNAGNHNGGAMHFGPDGKLYVAVGDNAQGQPSQSLTSVFGKILRFNPDGSIPTDNPFYGSTTGLNRAIWARGLRNPFTFGFQPGTSVMFINDVGENAWEEINLGRVGANYGWPNTEGVTSNPAYDSPLLAYEHDEGSPTLFSGYCIVGAGFYNPPINMFGAAYTGSYFFADYVSGWVYRLDPANGNAAYAFAQTTESPTDLGIGPDGALYLLVNSKILRIWR